MNKALVEVLKLIQKLYGKSAITKTIGTRTNVIKLPDNETKRYIKEELNIEAASDKLAKKAYEDMRELIRDVPKMNDQEVLTLKGNLQRLDNKLNPPMAEVTELGTGQKVSPEGIKTLIQQKGQTSRPGTLMGNLESRIKQLEASGKDLETIAKERGAKSLEDIMADALKSQGLSKQMYNEGLVRATARDIITSDIKSGKLKLPKELEQNILEGGGEPIDVLRNVYGEDALEVLDSLIPEFSKLRTSTEAADLAKSKFKFEPDVNRPKGSMTPEEAAKTEQENILVPKKPGEPEEFAMGGRAGYSAGSIVKGVLLTAKKLSELKPEYLKKLSRLEGYLGSINMDAKGGREAAKQTIDKIDNLKKEYRTLQKDLSEKEQLDKFDVKDRVSHAGGGISQGLDYLMGIERPNYQLGGSVYDRYMELLNQISNPTQVGQTNAVSYVPRPISDSRTEDTFTPIQTSIQQQLTPVGPLDALVNSYLQVPGILSTVVSMGKDYLGLTDAQKDLYGNLGFGYTQSGMKDKLGFNVMATNFLAPNSMSRQAYKSKLGYTDEQLDQIKNDLAGVPTKANMREQQREYDIAQTQRQQDYATLANQGVMGIGMNPSAYASHSLAAMGPAYDDPTERSDDTGPFGGYNDFTGTEGTFSTDTSGSAGSAGTGDTGSTCSCGSFKNGGHITGANARPNYAIGGRIGYADGTKPSAAENTPSQEIINRMIAQIKQLSKRGVDVATIKDIVGASDQMIKDVLGKQSGGVAYLMGM